MSPAAAPHVPLISVVIPTCGRPRLLERAITSVVCQTYSNWELLVVDDNDSASAAAIETETLLAAHQRDSRIRYLRHGRNRGGSQARNSGIAAAAGEYVAFLDDDDEWLPNKLEVQCRALGSLPADIAAVYCGYLVQSSALSTFRSVPARPVREPFPAILVDNFIGTTSTLLCRKAVFAEIGMFDTGLPAAQDRELLIRLCRSFGIACVREPLVRFNWHAGPRITKQRDKKLVAQELLYSRYADDLKLRPALHSTYLVALGKLQLECGDGGKAAETFLRAWLAKPSRLTPLVYALLATVDGSFYEWVRTSTWRVRRGVASRAGRYR